MHTAKAFVVLSVTHSAWTACSLHQNAALWMIIFFAWFFFLYYNVEYFGMHSRVRRSYFAVGNTNTESLSIISFLAKQPVSYDLYPPQLVIDPWYGNRISRLR